MNSPLRHAALYSEEGTTACPGFPALRGIRCRCGYCAFPPQRFGCEICGGHGDALVETLLSGRGTVLASATVRRHAKAEPAVPFTVVEVALVDGPVVRGLLVSGHDAELPPGAEVVTQLETLLLEGQMVRDLRFLPLES